MSNSNSIQGMIKFSSRIVDDLSSGLYESPAACLKELINNSFDADATLVRVFVKPDANRIIVEDNGCGINRAEFERHFSVISQSYKRVDSDTTPSGRPKIGKIGIGFIAANEICDIMEIISTKKGSKQVLEVSIRFDRLRMDMEETGGTGNEVARADYTGSVNNSGDLDSHYTHIFLKNIRGEARSILAGIRPAESSPVSKSLYGLAPKTVSATLKTKGLNSWDQFDEYSRNMLEIGLNVPVPYYDDWIPQSLSGSVDDIACSASSLGFTLKIDGSEIRKPIVFSPSQRTLIRRFDLNGKNVSANGYFFAQGATIRPQELQGLLIRIRNGAVGGYDRSFLGFPSSEGRLLQSWISGEISADDRLEEAMNIDRRTLRKAHPAYVELQRSVHEYVSEFIKLVRSEIYGERSRERRAAQATEVVRQIVDIAEQEINEVSPNAAIDTTMAWSSADTTPRGRKQVLRKYTVSQLYEFVVDAAKEVLTPDQIDEFLSRLTERLK